MNKMKPMASISSTKKDDVMEELDGVKRSWGQRLWSAGKIATNAARIATRQLVGAKGEADGRLGEALAKELDNLKGMAMKVGQILSYFDGILPEDTHKALRGLQQGMTPVSREQMIEVIEEAFGKPVDDLYSLFPQKPVAAASIGQVYRAQYKGQDVAVKVQYPGIWDTIRSDFSVLNKLSKLASLATAVDGPAIVHELQERFGEECNYLREAAYQQAFAKTFANNPNIVIPAVIAERTKTTVLTSQWCDGREFYTYVEDSTQEERNRVSRLLVQFAYQSLYHWGTLNADPHPGNYLFGQEGKVYFLDFGCIRRFDAEYLNNDRELARIVVKNERNLFNDALLATGIVAKPKSFDFDHYWGMLRAQYQPYWEKDFHFTQEFIKLGMEFSKPSSPNLRKIAIPPEWIWLQRLQWGLHAVLVRLNAQGTYQDLLMEALETPFEPMPIDWIDKEESSAS